MEMRLRMSLDVEGEVRKLWDFVNCKIGRRKRTESFMDLRRILSNILLSN